MKKLGSSSKAIISQDDEIELPKIKRKFNDLEKNKYLQESFLVLKEYFRKALIKTEQAHTNVKTLLKEISDDKFTATIYVDGDVKSICKIWIGSGVFSGNSILYSEGSSRLSFDNDNSFNGSAYLENNGIELYFKIMNMSFGMVDKNINLEKASANDLGFYYWKQFIQKLNY